MRGRERGQRTPWRVRNFPTSNIINPADWAFGNLPGGVQAQVRLDVVLRHRSPTPLASFDGELIDGGVNLAQIIDAGIGLRRGSGTGQVGNGDSRQQADDGYYDHDFHERKASQTALVMHFHEEPFSKSIAKPADRPKTRGIIFPFPHPDLC